MRKFEIMVNSFNQLKTDVIDKGVCIQCGACVVMCPLHVLEISEYPRLVGECSHCGICYEACPQIKDKNRCENTILKIFTAEAKNEKIRVAGQSGGVVSSLLISLLNAKFLDCSFAVASEPDWKPVAKIVKFEEEVLRCSKSKYERCTVFLTLKDGCMSNQNVGFVGLPCQVKAVKLLQEKFSNSIFSRIRLKIGLFCWSVFKHEFFEKLSEEFEIELERILKFDIGGGTVTCFTTEGNIKIPLSRANRYRDPACMHCTDFSALCADISIGSAGSPTGKSSVIIRTRRGEEAFEIASKDLNLQDIENFRAIRILEEKKSKRAVYS